MADPILPADTPTPDLTYYHLEKNLTASSICYWSTGLIKREIPMPVKAWKVKSTNNYIYRQNSCLVVAYQILVRMVSFFFFCFFPAFFFIYFSIKHMKKTLTNLLSYLFAKQITLSFLLTKTPGNFCKQFYFFFLLI